MPTTVRRVAAVLLAAAGLGALTAGPGAAHVTLHSSDAVQGATDVVLTIRVPNEEATSAVDQVEVDFPAATPLAGALVQPTPGWTVAVTTRALARPLTTPDGEVSSYVSRITWRGGTIPVGGYQDFDVDVSRLPVAPSVTVKALQHYADGDLVRWIELPGPEGQQPDHPAPTLALAAPTPAPRSPLPTARTSTTTDAVSLGALAAGLLGLAFGLLALVRSRRTPA